MRICRTLHRLDVARRIWPPLPYRWTLAAPLRLMARDLDPARLEAIARRLIDASPVQPTARLLLATARRKLQDFSGMRAAALEAARAFPPRPDPGETLEDAAERHALLRAILEVADTGGASGNAPLDTSELDLFIGLTRAHGSLGEDNLIAASARVHSLSRMDDLLEISLGLAQEVAADDPTVTRSWRAREGATLAIASYLVSVVECVPAAEASQAVSRLAERVEQLPHMLEPAALGEIARALVDLGLEETAARFRDRVVARDPTQRPRLEGEMLAGRVARLLKQGRVTDARELIDSPPAGAAEEPVLWALGMVLEREHRYAELAALADRSALTPSIALLVADALARTGDEGRARALDTRFDLRGTSLDRFDLPRRIDELERTGDARGAVALARKYTTGKLVAFSAVELRGLEGRAHLALGEPRDASECFERFADAPRRWELDRCFPLAPTEVAFLRPRVLAGASASFHLYGPPGTFTLRAIDGEVSVTPSSGRLPAVLKVTSRGTTPSLVPFGFEVASPAGAPVRASGTLFLERWRGTYAPCSPLDRDTGAWRAKAGDRFETDDLAFDWGEARPSEHVAAEDFAVGAECDIDVPAGRYGVATFADDGIRVFVDKRLVLDEWRARRRRESDADFDLDTGKHHVRVEYFHGGGPALLRCRLSAELR